MPIANASNNLPPWVTTQGRRQQSTRALKRETRVLVLDPPFGYSRQYVKSTLFLEHVRIDIPLLVVGIAIVTTPPGPASIQANKQGNAGI